MEMDTKYWLDTFSQIVRERKLKNDYANSPRSSNLHSIIPRLEIIAQERRQRSNSNTSFYKAASTKVVQCNLETSTPHAPNRPEVELRPPALRKRCSKHDVSIKINYKSQDGKGAGVSPKGHDAPVQALSRYCDRKLTDEDLAMIFLTAIKTLKARNASKINANAYKEAQKVMKLQPNQSLQIQNSDSNLKRWDIDSIRYVKHFPGNKGNSLDYKADFFEKEKILSLRSSDDKAIISKNISNNTSDSHTIILDKQTKKILSIAEIFDNDRDIMDSSKKDAAINIDKCPNIIFSEIQNYNLDTNLKGFKYNNQNSYKMHPCLFPSRNPSTRSHGQDTPQSDIMNQETDNPHFVKVRNCDRDVPNDLCIIPSVDSISKRKNNILRSHKLIYTQNFISRAINTDLHGKNFADNLLDIIFDKKEKVQTKNTCVASDQLGANTIINIKPRERSNYVSTKNSTGQIDTIYQNEDFAIVSEIDEAGTSCYIPQKKNAQVYRLDNSSNRVLFKAPLQTKTKVCPIPTKNIHVLRTDIPFKYSEDALSKTALKFILEGADQSTSTTDNPIHMGAIKQSVYNLADIFQTFKDDTSDGHYQAFVNTVFSNSLKKIIDVLGAIFNGLMKRGPNLASTVLGGFTNNIASANILPAFSGESTSTATPKDMTGSLRHSLPLSLLKPYICDICDMKFRLISQLQHHKEEHRDQSFKCTICKREFERTTKIREMDTMPHYHAVSSQEDIRERTRSEWGQFRRRKRKKIEQKHKIYQNYEDHSNKKTRQR